jgi:hypothetical protein
MMVAFLSTTQHYLACSIDFNLTATLDIKLRCYSLKPSQMLLQIKENTLATSLQANTAAPNKGTCSICLVPNGEREKIIAQSKPVDQRHYCHIRSS